MTVVPRQGVAAPSALVNLLSRLRARQAEAEKALAQIDEELRAVEQTLVLLGAVPYTLTTKEKQGGAR